MKNKLLFFLAFLWSACSFGQEFTDIGSGINYEVSSNVAPLTVFVSYNSDFVGEASIPDTVVYNNETYAVIGIYNDAFAGNAYLTKVTIPNSVGKIDMGTFQNCINLTSVTIPNSVRSIGSTAFQGCSSLASITIPDSVTSIGGNAFNECSSLTSVAIPNSVSSIGSAAFQGCSSLASITIPDSVTNIGEYTFDDCINLASVTIPNSVIVIGEFAFQGCSSLASVTIPDSVIIIGVGAFANCSSLVSVTIPDSVTSIEDGGFAGCSSLGSVTIPDSVTSIGNYTFAGCESLTSVTIPNSVTSIGQNAFVDCSGLTSVSVNWETPLFFDSVAPYFDLENLANVTLHVPCGTTDSYTEAGWLGFKSISSSAVISAQPQNQTIVEDQAVTFTVAATDVTSYQWEASMDGTNWMPLSDDFENPNVSGATSNSLTISGNNLSMISGYKFRVVLNAGACSITSEEVEATVTTLGTSSFQDTNFSYYPNPTEGILNIDYSKDIQQVTVVNMLGKLVQETKPNSNNTKVDLSSLAAGNYLVQVKTNEEIKTIKIVKK